MQNRLRFVLGSLAFAVLPACVVEDDAFIVDDPPSAEAQGDPDPVPWVSLGPCYQGMTTERYPIDPTAQRCTLAELPVFTSYLTGGDIGLQLMAATLASNATPIQCHTYTLDDGSNVTCADVVDRFDPDTALDERTEIGVDSRLYFIAYAVDVDSGDVDGNVAMWDAALQDGWLLSPPVSLSVAGYLSKYGELREPSQGRSPARSYRLFKFDPRLCPQCLPYDGPNKDKVFDPGKLVNEWYPELRVDSVSCNFETDPGQWIELSRGDCEADIMYRRTSR